jgi:hypothetical protein
LPASHRQPDLGSTWLVIKDQIALSPPVDRDMALCAGGGGHGAAGLGAARIAVAERAGMALAAVLGLLQFCGNFQLVYRSEHYVTSGLVAVMYAC